MKPSSASYINYTSIVGSCTPVKITRSHGCWGKCSLQIMTWETINRTSSLTATSGQWFQSPNGLFGLQTWDLIWVSGYQWGSEARLQLLRYREPGVHSSWQQREAPGKPEIIIQWFREMSGFNKFATDTLLLSHTDWHGSVMGDLMSAEKRAVVSVRGWLVILSLQSAVLAGPGEILGTFINNVPMAANVITNMPWSFSTPCLHWHKDQISPHWELRASSALAQTPGLDYKQPWLAQIASQGCKDKEIKN